MKIKVIVKRVPKNLEVLVSPSEYKSKPIIRFEKTSITTPRCGIVLYYKYNSYALVFVK